MSFEIILKDNNLISFKVDSYKPMTFGVEFSWINSTYFVPWNSINYIKRNK